MLPTWTAHLSFVQFLIQFSFAAVLFCGFFVAYQPLRPWLFKKPQNNPLIFCEAAVIVPWLLFPLLLISALLGFYRWALAFTQLALGIAGLVFVLQNGKRGLRNGLKTLQEKITERSYFELILSAQAAGAVLLFIYWGWVMPFPESFNGYVHAMFSAIHHTAQTGLFDPPALRELTYDNIPILAPTNTLLFLSLFHFPWWEAIGPHPMTLVPGLMAFVTWQWARQVSRQATGKAVAGDMLFLSVAFSYRMALNFFEVEGDLMSPVMVVALLWFLIQSLKNKSPHWVGLGLVLLLSFISRKQVFLFSCGVLVFCLAFRVFPLKWKGLFKPLVLRSLFLLSLPFLTYLAWMSVEYKNPLFPMGTFRPMTLLEGIFPHQPYVDLPIPSSPAEAAATDPPWTHWFVRKGLEENFLMEHLFPLFPKKGPLIFVKNLFCGLSVSLFVTMVFLVALRRNRLVWAFLVGAGVVWYVFFPMYPKYLQYSGLFMAFFGSVFLLEQAQKIRWGPPVLVVVYAALQGTGLLFWATNNWGHAQKDTRLENIRFLFPGYKTPLDRLARKSSVDAPALQTEINEYNAALDSLQTGESVLHMDLEPGALIPSLLNREYLGHFFYLESHKGEPLLKAQNEEELAQALKELKVQYFYLPRRGHSYDHTFIFKRIRAYQAQPQKPYQYVVPSGLLFSPGLTQ